MKKILVTLVSLFALVAFADEAATTTTPAANTESKTEMKKEVKKEAKADKNGHKKMKKSKKVESSSTSENK